MKGHRARHRTDNRPGHRTSFHKGVEAIGKAFVGEVRIEAKLEARQEAR